MKNFGTFLLVCLILSSTLASAGFFEKITGKISLENLKSVLFKKYTAKKAPTQIKAKSKTPKLIQSSKIMQPIERTILQDSRSIVSFQDSFPTSPGDISTETKRFSTGSAKKWRLTKNIQNPLFIDQLIVHPEDENKIMIIAGEANVEHALVYVSDNGGDTWTMTLGSSGTEFLGNDPRISFTEIIRDMNNPNIVYAMTYSGKLYKTDTFGMGSPLGPTWVEISDISSDSRFHAIAPMENVALLSSSQINYGAIRHLAIDVNNPNKFYAYAATHSDTQPGLFISEDGGFTWNFYTYGLTLLPGEGWPLVWDSIQNEDNGYLFIGIEYGSKPIAPDGNWWVLYDAPLLRSVDGGYTWEDISPRNIQNQVLSDEPSCNNLICPSGITGYDCYYAPNQGEEICNAIYDHVHCLYDHNHVHFVEIDQENNILYFHEEGPRFFKSYDDGETYEFITCSPEPYFFEMKVNDNNPYEIIVGEPFWPGPLNEERCDPNFEGTEGVTYAMSCGRLWETEDGGETYSLIADLEIVATDIEYTGDYNAFYVATLGQGIRKFEKFKKIDVLNRKAIKIETSVNEKIIEQKTPREQIEPIAPSSFKVNIGRIIKKFL